MFDLRSTVQSASVSRYHVVLAVDDGELREAPRLPHQVFAEEAADRLHERLPYPTMQG